MSNEEAKSERQSDNMEQVEDKVNVEEAIINMGCIKKELDDEEVEFDENRYKIALTFENIFGESSREQEDNKDSLIGFLDDEVIMETGTIKLEDIKEEKALLQKIIVQSHCNKCGGKYEGYCPDCSSLSYILNNLTPNIKPEAILNTMPINTLQIREVSSRQAVFSLKTLPKGIIIGPFDGVTPIQSTTGLQWKIKDKKLVNEQNGNWMKYIQSVGNHASKNLDVFQMYGLLYFETSRKIQEGEELLVCYREEKDEALKSEKEEEFYLTPVKKEEYPKVFACTHCCLGFRLEGCLVEHKSKCPQGDHGDSSEDSDSSHCSPNEKQIMDRMTSTYAINDEEPSTFIDATSTVFVVEEAAHNLVSPVRRKRQKRIDYREATEEIKFKILKVRLEKEEIERDILKLKRREMELVMQQK